MAQISVAGIFWYRNEEEFERLRAVSEDGAKFPESHAAFLKSGELGIQELERRGSGIKVVKVEVDPDEYLSWCGSLGLKVNSTSRQRFAREKAFVIAKHELDSIGGGDGP